MKAATAHRPWAVPRQSWSIAMQWHDLLFMHWPIPMSKLRDHIPSALTIDTFDGAAWIGVVPFRMARVRPRFIPSLPYISAFPELNVRTYVTINGKPGVWFFSLDAGNPIAVQGARFGFHLPYYDAHMHIQQKDQEIQYRSSRTHRNARPARFQATYRPTGAIYRSTPGTLEHWLTERYCLYAANQRGAVWRGDIHHAPWPLQAAEAEIEVNTMTHQIPVALPNTRPLLHFARFLDVIGWRPQRAA